MPRADLSALRVVLDDRPLRRTRTGVGNYIAQLLLHLPEAEFNRFRVSLHPFVFTHVRRGDWRSALTAPAGPTSTPVDPKDVGGGRKPWWLRSLIQTGYGAYFRWCTRGRYDLYHEPNHIPVRCGLPTVTTIHDLSVVLHPNWHPADRVRWYERDFRAGLAQTRHFIAASEFTRREMIQHLGLPGERITVTYQAPRSAFFTPDPADDSRRRTLEQRAAILRELAIPERYFLYVGTLEPRKNLPGLLDAFAALPPAIRREHPLVIVGPWGWKAERIRALLAQRDLSSDVRLLGYLHDQPLSALYSRCTALVWPTFYEGFGLPPLEAMACSAPVIVSSAASLPEVVGSAGVLLPPESTAAWTEAMRRVAEDAAWRAERCAASVRQAQRFSWSRCAAETISVYGAVLA